MRGISEEKLKKIRDSEGMHGTTMWRLTECFVEDLNPWMPIGMAPKGRKILLRFPNLVAVQGGWSDEHCRYIPDIVFHYEGEPTHWQELPPDPELPETPK